MQTHTHEINNNETSWRSTEDILLTNRLKIASVHSTDRIKIFNKNLSNKMLLLANGTLGGNRRVERLLSQSLGTRVDEKDDISGPGTAI